MKAYKSFSQKCPPNSDMEELMKTFTTMVNRCIRIGLKEGTHNMKRLSGLCYHELRDFDILSSYKLCAISRAAGILSNREQSIRRGRKAGHPTVKNPFITNCYGVRHNGSLLTIPYRKGNPVNILLNEHTQKMLTGLDVRSFTMNRTRISICASKEVEEIECTNTVGIDRNLRNVTCGNGEKVTFFKTNKLVSVLKNTRHARSGFRRNDRRKKIAFWKERQARMSRRRNQYVHRISKGIVDDAVRTKSMVILEDLEGIRKLYRKGNGQGNKYRGMMNSWPFYELQRQIEYKARWVGLPVISIDPRRTSTQCPRCGKRLQEDAQHSRKELCTNCGLFMDRDVIAAMNIARKGARKLSPRFRDSRDGISEAQSGTFEPAMSEPRTPASRIVDMSKSTLVK